MDSSKICLLLGSIAASSCALSGGGPKDNQSTASNTASDTESDNGVTQGTGVKPTKESEEGKQAVGKKALEEMLKHIQQQVEKNSAKKDTKALQVEKNPVKVPLPKTEMKQSHKTFMDLSDSSLNQWIDITAASGLLHFENARKGQDYLVLIRKKDVTTGAGDLTVSYMTDEVNTKQSDLKSMHATLMNQDAESFAVKIKARKGLDAHRVKFTLTQGQSLSLQIKLVLHESRAEREAERLAGQAPHLAGAVADLFDAFGNL